MKDLTTEASIERCEQSRAISPNLSTMVSPKRRSDSNECDDQPSNGHYSQCIADQIQHLSDSCNPHVPNPAPLGLIAFGLTTALLQLKHTRLAGDDEDLEGVDTVVMGFAMFFGGLLQLIAGVSEIRRNNIFGYTAFCLYGGFWMSVGTIEIVTLLASSNGIAYTTNPKAIQAMLFMVSIFTYMLWVLTFKINKTICSLFFLLGTTCLLLSFGVHNETVDRVGGYFGLVTSFNAFWLAFAELVNDVIGEGKEELIPLGHWKTNQFQRSGGAHVPGRIHGARLSLSPNSRLVAATTTTNSRRQEDDDNDIEEGRTNASSSDPL